MTPLVICDSDIEVTVQYDEACNQLIEKIIFVADISMPYRAFAKVFQKETLVPLPYSITLIRLVTLCQ